MLMLSLDYLALIISNHMNTNDAYFIFKKDTKLQIPNIVYLYPFDYSLIVIWHNPCPI